MTEFVDAEPLKAEFYRPYGDVVSARDDVKAVPANMGTARRFSWLAELLNNRPGDAQANLSVYQCAPAKNLPFRVKLLERHAHSTQVFIPMGGPARYLVVVCRGGDAPDLDTLKAFVADGRQGISYRPGVWHHPMIALDAETDFACLVYEDGTSGDCEVRDLEQPLSIRL